MFHIEKHCYKMLYAWCRNSTGQWVWWTPNHKITFGHIVLM